MNNPTGVKADAAWSTAPSWLRAATNATPSWYLHPMVARHKSEAHAGWIRRWRPEVSRGALLKTDLFEDAFGEDTLLPVLLETFSEVVGVDLQPHVVKRARQRFPTGNLRPLVADCRALPLVSASVGTVFSPSTLDHFHSGKDFHCALAELARVLEPGGVLFLTLDNAWNPLYWILRALSRSGLTPYPLGYSPSAPLLDRELEAAGFEVLGREWLIHNPRLLSTALFLGLEKSLGRRADGFVKGLLRCFDCLGRLPSRALTACFVATRARKRLAP